MSSWNLGVLSCVLPVVDRGCLTCCSWAPLSASPCRWWLTPCGRCGALELASMTTSTPAPWRRGSTRWKTFSPSTSLWSQACRQASSCSWPIYYGENTDWKPPFERGQEGTHYEMLFAVVCSFHPHVDLRDYLDHVTAHTRRSNMFINDQDVPNEVRSTDGRLNQVTKLHKDSRVWKLIRYILARLSQSVCLSLCFGC